MIIAIYTYLMIGAGIQLYIISDPEVRREVQEWPVRKWARYYLIVITMWPLIVFGGRR